MLEPRRRGAAEHEGQPGNEAAFEPPAAPPEDEEHADPAGQQAGEHRRIHAREARHRVEQRQGQHRRREDQRLRIGELHVPAVNVRRPCHRLAAMQRRRQKAQLGIEMVLGIPRYREAAHEPRPAQQRPERNQQRHGPRQTQFAAGCRFSRALLQCISPWPRRRQHTSPQQARTTAGAVKCRDGPLIAPDAERSRLPSGIARS